MSSMLMHAFMCTHLVYRYQTIPNIHYGPIQLALGGDIEIDANISTYTDRGTDASDWYLSFPGTRSPQILKRSSIQHTHMPFACYSIPLLFYLVMCAMDGCMNSWYEYDESGEWSHAYRHHHGQH